NEIDNFDYFLRADDDSFYIMENLRFFLLSYNKSDPLYIGARFKFGVPNGYMSGGSGVILTKAAIKRLVPNFGNASICPQATSDNDDLELGICVQNLNITSVDTRDNQGRHRMFPWGPGDHLMKGLEPRHFDYLYYPYNQNQKFDCCANNIISFHYVYGDMLYMIEFLTYHAKLIGTIDKSWAETIMDNDQNFGVPLLEQLKKASKKVNFNQTIDL
uniref:N-acetylgalactosaminide beta-1,3-galactosyltransferase n=1 Tax=Panagrolaimus sp. ES5 TaxID=591445 RepID=A0AC34GEE5_9BILA